MKLNDNKLPPVGIEEFDDWKRYNVTKISKGYHTLLWRYTKLNTLPLTEFMEAEIEVSSFIVVF